jgi:hypothetical protein
MGIMHRIRSSYKVWTATDPVVAEAQTMKALMKEDLEWRRVGSSATDLAPWDHEKMQKIVLNLYRRNHWGARLLEVIVDFVWGDGITVSADSEDEAETEAIQEVIDDFWFDPLNDLSRQMEQTILEWNLWGEVCMPVLKNDADGRIRLGWITPSAIHSVIPDKLGRPHTIEIADEYSEQVGQDKLRVIQIDPETGEMEGDCFFFTINTVRGAFRGVSELYSAADWLDVLVNSLKANADRTKLSNHFIWDVEVKGMDEERLTQWKKDHAAAPAPNSVRVHNENVTWKAESPNLGAVDFAQHIQTLKSFIMAGFGYPNHWFGSGDDANKATASVMAEPTRKSLKRKQKQVKWMISDILRYVLYSAKKAGRLAESVDLSKDPFVVQIPDVGGSDAAVAAASTQGFINAVAGAESSGFLSTDTAIEITALVLSETGIEIDPATEKEKIAADAEKEADNEEAEMLEQEERLRASMEMDVIGPKKPEEESEEMA